MSGHLVYVPNVYRYRTEAEIAAEAEQPTTTVAPESAEPAIDLDAELNRLDAELAKFDDLVTSQGEFPNTIANTDGKLKELEAQDLDTLQALEPRSAPDGQVIEYAPVSRVAGREGNSRDFGTAKGHHRARHANRRSFGTTAVEQ